MKTRCVLVVLGIAALLVGCGTPRVVQRPVQVYSAPPPQPQMYQQQSAGEDDYIGNVSPLYFDAYPGVAFYQRWDAFGCNCIVPVAYYGGAWITYLGVPVVYRGVWQRPPVYIVNTHRTRLHTNPHIFHRSQGRVVHVRPAQHVAPRAPAHVPQRHVAPPPPRAHVLQQQVKPTTLAPKPAPAKAAPPKKAKCSDGSWKVKC